MHDTKSYQVGSLRCAIVDAGHVTLVCWYFVSCYLHRADVARYYQICLRPRACLRQDGSPSVMTATIRDDFSTMLSYVVKEGSLVTFV